MSFHICSWIFNAITLKTLTADDKRKKDNKSEGGIPVVNALLLGVMHYISIYVLCYGSG